MAPLGPHLKIVAVLFLGLGLLGLLGAAISSILFGVLADAAISSQPFDRRPFGLTGMALSGVLLLLAVPPIVSGIGMLKRQRWARMLGIAVALVLLGYIPYGPVIGLYALWALLERAGPLDVRV